MILPSFIMLPRKTLKDKKIMMNFNTVKTLHHMQYNIVKKAFKEQIKPLFKDFEAIDGQCKVKYKITAHNKRKFDLLNIVTIIDKFLLDALQDFGIIEEDNFEIVIGYEVEFGGIDSTLKERLIEVELEKK